MLPEQQQRILGYFIEEARDHLNTIEQGLLNLQSTLNDPEMINEVFRAAHSIKGGAAMLGLSSIQHTSHRLEDCFKILKEHPVQIDQKLESLFLGVSDTLKALLEHLTGPFGLTEDAANTLMSETEPVFEWLHEHLELLVQQSSNQATSSRQITASNNKFKPQEISTLHVAPEIKTVGEFQTQVLQKLREMLQLFKRSPTQETRQELQDCCYELARFGESLNFSNWCGLCRDAGSAIALPENSFLSLAKTVITEIKQALELATQNRDSEIAISPQLKTLLSVLEIDLLEISDNLIAEPSIDKNLITASTLSTNNLDIAAPTENNFADFELEPQDSISSLTELSTPLNLDSEDTITSLTELSTPLNLDSEDTITSLTELSTPLNLDSEDTITSLTELSTPLNLDSEDSITSLTELSASANQDQDNFADIFSSDRNNSQDHKLLNNRSIDLNGPEVGIAELNALADFFEGETPDLDETWQKVEILEDTSDGELLIDISNYTEDADNDFADLLSLEKEPSSNNYQTNTTATEDLTLLQLFDDNLLEQASLFPETAITNLELSDNSNCEEMPEVASSSDEIALNNEPPSDVVDDLLALTLNENELFSLGEVTQPEAENINATFTSAKTSSLNDIDSIEELSPEQDNNFDRVFTETANANSVEEIPLTNHVQKIPQSQKESFSLDSLFAAEEETIPSTTKSESGDLFDLLNFPTTAEIYQSEEDFNDFWSQEPEEELHDRFNPEADLDAVRALEASLFAAAASGDIFGNSEQASEENFDIEDIDITFLQGDLIFASDVDDDLFAQFTSTESADLFSDRESPQDIHNLPQQHTTQSQPENLSDAMLPEAVDIVPEFTTSNASTKSFEEETNLLDTTFDENNNDTLNIEDTPKIDTTESSLVAQDFFAREIAIDINAETYEPQLETQEVAPKVNNSLQAAFNFTETDFYQDENLAESELNLINDLFSGENFLLEPNQEIIPETIIEENTPKVESDNNDLFATENLLVEENQEFLPETVVESDNNDLFATENLLVEENQEFLTETVVETDNNNVLATENLLVEENQEFLPETTIEESTSEAVLEIADDEDLLEIPESENAFNEAISEVEIIENESATLEYIRAETKALEDVDTANSASVLDEFADLEALLKEEVTSTPDMEISDIDFADLEALLGEEKASTVTPIAVNNVTSKAVSSELPDEFGDLEKLLKEADQTISHSPTVTSSTGKNQRQPRRGARFEETMRVPVKHLDDMSNLVGELVVNRNTLEEDQGRQRQSLDNLLHQIQQLSDVGARMQELYERSLLEASLLASRKYKESLPLVSDSNTDRGFSELEMDRFTPFHTLSQEMIELIVRVRESASDIDFVTEETERVARQFRQVTTQLQEGLTKARMEPFSQATDGLQRGVRDTAIKHGRQVELVIEGGDTFIDKMIVEHLKTPLNHMLNNAIAHGIETPEVRQQQGKPPVGTISVRAFHQGNQTIISVKDDGAGINTDQVKAKAIAKNLISAEKAKSLSPIEIYDLLFEPNFSTKDEADELSGRGVGMDVVRTSISEIRGTITTDSTIGKGTTFTIRLPLTLSICKALCCVSDKARIAFPMDGVEDTLDIPAKNIHTNAEGQSFISWRDTMLPFRPLKELLTFNRLLSRGNVYGGNRDDDMISVIVVRSANTLVALQIDQVLSEQEIVIKQFERPAPKPIGVAGATVLGDGRIMPIADVLEIIDIFQGRTVKQSGLWEQKNTSATAETPATKIDPTVLIVDDSITVRELLSLTFNKAGYRVEQARDGQEAWDKLRSGLPCDIVFCDIEMPRCDGLELLSRIQKDSTLNHLPIAMLTSRGADKHRQMAVQLGASGYFTKPYLEEALLEAASRMLKGEKLVNSANNA
ncbi:CheA signal transduction histidine kinase [Tolypothrix sp. NIES-4075]|uniref:hybrid sensor histidine kinase/response regulator n=1 Tax=Tolypothrix sp. NIES-4075 TaxID=2005459 RepID=UPI000B5C543D|nr:response regulator [Tolypothrix sp. NIES-4075]GAX42519.1 CheA signal transduction histidine kinase [Tolypothrix sp. NIES-4075]